MGPADIVRGAPDRALEQIADPLLQDAVGRKPDRILDPLGFQELVDLGHGEGRVGAEIEARDLAPIARHDRLQHVLPAVGAVDVAGTQRAAFQITELVEHEQRMVAGAGVVAVPDAHLLLAMGRADARIHVEHDASRRTAAMNAVDPLAGKIGERREVLLRRQPARLEAPHLARRCRRARSRLAADDPAHRRIMAQAFGVVHILVSGKPPEHRLPQQPDQRMAAVLAGACVGEHVARHRAEAESVVEFAIGQQSGIGGDPGAMELELQPAVEIEPERAIDRFTRRVLHDGLTRFRLTC